MLTSNSAGICSAEWQVSVKGIPTERPATWLGIGVAKHKTLYKVSPLQAHQLHSLKIIKSVLAAQGFIVGFLFKRVERL